MATAFDWLLRWLFLVLLAGLARRATYFSLAIVQRNLRKRKATRSLGPCASLRAPCSARAKRGLARTRYAQTIASPFPLGAPLLSPARTGGGQKSDSDSNSNSNSNSGSIGRAPESHRSSRTTLLQFGSACIWTVYCLSQTLAACCRGAAECRVSCTRTRFARVTFDFAQPKPF